MKNEEILEKITEIITPVLNEEALELVHIELKREPQGGLVLRLFIDREGGVNLDVCCRASKTISPLLDIHNLINEPYNLEVSSPGIERPLTKPEDFRRFVGSKIFVKTAEPINKRRQFTGTVKASGNQAFIIDCDKNLYEIPYELVLKAHLKVDIEF